MKASLIVVAALAAALALSFSACTKKDSAPPPTGAAGSPVTDLKIEDLKVGDGDAATSGKIVSVHYTGWLTDGTKFDSSLDRGTPFQFILGHRQVIPGWDQGVLGMKVGGKRRLTIPSSLAYGARSAGAKIPPNATLIFEVELLGVVSHPGN